jgi:hypothetical protein
MNPAEGSEYGLVKKGRASLLVGIQKVHTQENSARKTEE